MNMRALFVRVGMLCSVCVYVSLSARNVIAGTEPLTVTSFSPTGIARDVRQVQAVFSEPVVAFGAGATEAPPFTVTCGETGSARWLDERTWVYEFSNDLPSGVRCVFDLKRDLTALSGARPLGAQEFSFSTGGPVVFSSNPYETSSVEEEPYFKLILTGPVDLRSVEEHVSFINSGIESPIGVSIVDGSLAEELWKADGDTTPPERRLILKPKLRLAASSRLKLVWGAGVRAPSGEVSEVDQVMEFSVRAPLFATVACTRVNPEAGCVPFRPIHLSFSAPIPMELAKQVRLKDGAGHLFSSEPSDGFESNLSDFLQFNGPFPESTELTVDFPSGFQDDTGRLFERSAPLVVNIDEYPPLAKFNGEFGIIERGEEQLLPLTVRNIEPAVALKLDHGAQLIGGSFPGRSARITSIEEILTWLEKARMVGHGDSFFGATPVNGLERFEVPRTSGAKEMEVIGIPLKKPGFYAVEVESPALGKAYLAGGKPFYVHTTALVTDLSVHLKIGAEKSLVWVTSLQSGLPVGEAAVTITDCHGKVFATGQTDTNGIFSTEGVPERIPYEQCGGKPANHVAVARKGDDLSFTLSSWDTGIEVWRFGLPTGEWNDTFEKAHTIIAQSLVRRGDTVKMKHLLRRRTGEGLRFPNRDLPGFVRLVHLGSYENFELPLSWGKNGSVTSEWKVPPGAKLGTYMIELVRKKKNDQEDTLSAGTLRVEDFRVPLMRGVVALPSDTIVAPTTVPVTASVAYLSGGGASKLPVTVRYKLQPQWYFSIPGVLGYAVANGPVKEGSEEGNEQNEEGQLLTTGAVLDDTGSATVSLDRLNYKGGAARISAELEYKDVAGFVQTVSAAASVWPADVLLGIKTDRWLSKSAVPVEVVATSPRGERKGGIAVTVDIYQRKGFSNRKRIVGGFYSYESHQETSRIGNACSGTTDDTGLFRCTVQLPESGEFLIEAKGIDAGGRTTAANTGVWLSAGERLWFGGRDDDRIDVIPEKSTYGAEETARFQVRMPFEKATALVTVEREGVIDSFVQPLESSDPVVAVPLKAAYAPNVYISVLVVRGRVGGHTPTALVDLGRPAFKFGIAKIDVGWKPHEIQVAVTPERDVYRVREKARVKITAVGALDGKPIANGEIALAAVDEGILELQPNESWNLLSSMMGLRPYNVTTSTAQLQVVGRRHYGLKARADGGGGGKGPTRELFDALLYWNPRVALDKNGVATVDIPLNDSLTSFRIAAVTSAGESRFGTGTASIRATQDLIVVPGFPPVVRSGDTVQNVVSLRNTTDKEMPVEISLTASDPRVSGAAESRTLVAGGSAEVVWRSAIPEGLDELSYTVTARVGEAVFDKLTVKQRVVAPAVERVYDATLRQLAPDVVVPVEIPRGAIPGKGGLVVALSARLGDGLRGVIEAMRRYPYTCLEQRVSRAIALGDAKMWGETMAILPTYVDATGKLKYFVTEWEGSSVLTAYVLSIAAARGWAIPATERGKMVGALRTQVSGIAAGPQSSTANQAEKLIALEALSRAGEDITDLVQDIVIDPTMLATSNLINWYLVVHRTTTIPDRVARLEAARSNLRARLNLSGTALGFSTEAQDKEWWLMGSVDVNAVRLLGAVLETGDWASDIPRIAQGAIGRQVNGAWDLTVANAWGALAFPRFSARFEKAPVRGESEVLLDGAGETARWGGKADPAPVTVPWPVGKADLKLAHRGSGTPWVTIQSRAVVPITEPMSRGYTVRKTVEPVMQRASGAWSSGDIVRVTLEVNAQADRTWVVVDDPIPPGAAIIGGESLSKSMVADTTTPATDDRIYPTFEERTFEAYRGYIASLDKGVWRVQYTMRLNTAGDFLLPETRVEALYSPDMFGVMPNPRFVIAP